MGILFTCPHCGAQTEVETQFLGQTGPCFACGKVVEVTLPPAETWSPEEVFRQPRGKKLTALLQLVGVAAVLVLFSVGGFSLFFWVLLPLLGMDVEAARRLETRDKLQRIAEALQQYHDDYGRLPPPYTVDANGAPMHSWRALLIPYLDEGGTMGGYDFSQPWNSKANTEWHAVPFEPFQLPDDAISVGINHTGYMVVVGIDTLFPENGMGTSLSQATDGADATLLVVEVADSGVHWLEPSDLDRSTMTFRINGDPRTEISDPKSRGAWVAMADGAVRFVPQQTPSEEVRRWATCASNDNP